MENTKNHVDPLAWLMEQAMQSQPGDQGRRMVMQMGGQIDQAFRELKAKVAEQDGQGDD